MYLDLNKLNIPIKYNHSFKDKLIGMMFKKKKENILYCFPNCNSIHTFFMFQNIDVIMTDKNNKVLYHYTNVKPNRIILPKKNVYYTYEISHGFLNIKKED